MSLILGALGGAGQALQEVGAANQKAQIAQDQATLESNLAQSRAEALEVFKQTLTTNTANQVREAQANRINAAAGGMADQANAAKRGIVQQGIADPSSWTPEQQAAVDQSIALDKQNTMADPRTLAKAATSTGDYAAAQELTKIADAGKVSAGWGGVVVDQNDIDPATGQPRVIIDNSDGRMQLGEGANKARQTAAEARMKMAEAQTTRSNAIADAVGSRDPVLQSLGVSANSARIELDRLRGLDAANPARPGQSSAYAPLIEKAQQAYDDASQRLLDRQKAHLVTPPGGNGAAGRTGLTDNGSPADVAVEQIRMMQSELKDPKTADADKPAIQREIDRLTKIANTPVVAPVTTPVPTAAPARPGIAASAARPPLSAFLK